MPVSRFSQVSRRAFLSGASLAAITGLAACGSNDSSSGSTTTQAASTPTDTPSATQTTSAVETTAASSAASSAKASTASGTLPASAQATVSFTYTTSGGMAKNPYYAVWIEDASGNFVKTLLLCHLSGQDRWLNEMTAWYQASGGTDTTTEGTKPAGTYSVTWDGTDANGSRVKAGTYIVCIESNREHGSESLITSKQSFGSKALDVDLGTNGELTAAHLKYTA